MKDLIEVTKLACYEQQPQDDKKAQLVNKQDQSLFMPSATAPKSWWDHNLHGVEINHNLHGVEINIKTNTSMRKKTLHKVWVIEITAAHLITTDLEKHRTQKLEHSPFYQDKH